MNTPYNRFPYPRNTDRSHPIVLLLGDYEVRSGVA